MIALDSNVLIRLLVEDDPVQANLAGQLIEAAREREEPCFISDPALCEVEWVLDSAYRASRRDIVAALQSILTSPFFIFDDAAAIEHALDHYCQGQGDFSDYLIGARATKRGARTTYTFDKDLRDEQGFTLLK